MEEKVVTNEETLVETETTAEPEFAAEPETVAESVTEQEAAVDTETVETTQGIEVPKKKKSKKGIIISIISLILVVAIVAGIFLFKGRDNAYHYTMYIKDNALYYTSLENVAPIKVCDDVFNEEGGLSASIIKASGLSGYYVATKSQLLSDNKTLIYPQKISYDSATVNLFYKDIETEGAQEVKIDSEISDFSITKDEKTIIYSKADKESYDIYKYTIATKQKEKIVDNATIYEISNDCSKIMYLNDDNALYVYDVFAEKENKEKIDADVKSVFYNNDDFSVLRYLTTEKEIYEKTAGENRKKLAEKVHSVIASYDSGETYFLKVEQTSIPYSDLFTDDMKDKDKDVADADEMYDNNTFSVFKEWYPKNYAAYSRKTLRKNVEGQKIEKSIFSLNCITATGEKELVDNLATDQFGFSYAYASDKPVLVFNTVDKNTMRKLKISEIDWGKVTFNEKKDKWEYSKEDVEVFTIFRETVEKNYFDANKLKMVVGETVTDIDEDRAYDITVAKDGSAVYFIDNIDFEKEEPKKNRDFDEEWSEDIYYFEDANDDDIKELNLNHDKWSESVNNDLNGEIVEIKITEGVAGNEEVIDSDVSLYGIRLENDNESLTYFKNYDSEKNVGDYYLNGTEIAYDIKGSAVTFISTEEIYYLTEYDEEDEVGELKLYDGEENVLIASDVYHYEKTSAGDIVFISDYSTKNDDGTLYLVGKKENILIDYDVSSVVETFSNKTKLFSTSNPRIPDVEEGDYEGEEVTSDFEEI